MSGDVDERAATTTGTTTGSAQERSRSKNVLGAERIPPFPQGSFTDTVRESFKLLTE